MLSSRHGGECGATAEARRQNLRIGGRCGRARVNLNGGMQVDSERERLNWRIVEIVAAFTARLAVYRSRRRHCRRFAVANFADCAFKRVKLTSANVRLLQEKRSPLAPPPMATASSSGCSLHQMLDDFLDQRRRRRAMLCSSLEEILTDASVSLHVCGADFHATRALVCRSCD